MKQRILVINPDGMTNVIEGEERSLEELQSCVGGHIETAETVLGTMVMNEEGKILGLPVNYAATVIFNKDRAEIDEIRGNVMIFPEGLPKD